MHEEGRATRRGEGGGDFLADVAALADSGDDNAPAGIAQDAQCIGKGAAHRPGQGLAQPVEPLAFKVEGPQCGCNRKAAQLFAVIDRPEFAQWPFGCRHGF